MRKICLIGLCMCALCGGANAAVSGFGTAKAPNLGLTVDNDFCNQCVTWLLCGADYGYNAMANSDCGFDPMQVVNDFDDLGQDFCRSSAPSAYNVSQVRSLFSQALYRGAHFAWEFNCGISDAAAEWVRNREYAVEIIQFCHQVGACICGTGKYVQPVGVQQLRWGANSQCLQCPSGGTSNDNGNNLYILSCYIASGSSFSDDTGSGIVTDTCPYTVDGNTDPLESIH